MPIQVQKNIQDLRDQLHCISYGIQGYAGCSSPERRQDGFAAIIEGQPGRNARKRWMKDSRSFSSDAEYWPLQCPYKKSARDLY
jgi:hypothetical protein